MRMLEKAAIVAAFTFSALAATQASAWEATRAPAAVRLSTAEVDFQDRAAVKGFYKRLERAAARSCDSQIADLSAYSQDARCAREAMAEAVANLRQPMVTALHQAKSGPAYARGY